MGTAFAQGSLSPTIGFFRAIADGEAQAQALKGQFDASKSLRDPS